MNLKTLKTKIPQQILQRGKDYFNEGAITHIQAMENGEWIAEVEGNYGNYNVEVKIKNNDTLEKYYCNCPYDGDICKHVVAVLLHIEKNPSVKTTKKVRKQKPEWIQLLEELPEKELRKFIIAYAEKDNELCNDIVINFRKTAGKINIERYKTLIDKIFIAVSDDYGHIYHDSAYDAFMQISSLLNKANQNIKKENFHEAFSIAAAVAQECIKSFEYIDDSDGEYGEIINESFGTIDTLLEECGNQKLSDEVYEWLVEQMNNSDYNDYGCEDTLEEVFLEWANTPQRNALANNFLEKQIKKHAHSDDWSKKYQFTKFMKFKMYLLEKAGKTGDIEKLINKNIHIGEFREIRVKECIDKKDYGKATELIKEGIKISEKESLSGVTHNWQKQLLEIYTSTGNTVELGKLSRIMFFENQSKIEYYRLYKQTVPAGEWEEQRDKIITKLTPKKSNFSWGNHFSHNLAAVFIEENMWTSLFSHLERNLNIHSLCMYSKYLKDGYSEKLIGMFRKVILILAQNTGRKVYEDLKKYLKEMAGLPGGLAKAKNLKQELLNTYANRPAMKEILSKMWS